MRKHDGKTTMTTSCETEIEKSSRIRLPTATPSQPEPRGKPSAEPPFCWQNRNVLRRIQTRLEDSASALAIYVALTEISSEERGASTFQVIPNIPVQSAKRLQPRGQCRNDFHKAALPRLGLRCRDFNMPRHAPHVSPGQASDFLQSHSPSPPPPCRLRVWHRRSV
jgi:hypothetical protein